MDSTSLSSPGTDLAWMDIDSSIASYIMSRGIVQESSPKHTKSPDRSRGELAHATSSSEDPERLASLDSARKRIASRKGHTKSRLGCLRCKKKKIKCQETRPMCRNCERAKALCEYPENSDTARLHSLIIQPQNTPTVFTMTDMRLFHHFLLTAYPHLPVGADAIWTLEIPAFAHEYEYLLRAMLALGASHLELTSPSSLQSEALVHRGQAIKSLNRALSNPPSSRIEADARFATFMVLTFQSTCMKEGLIDFLVMLRGCSLAVNLDDDSRFSCFLEERHVATMDALINKTEQLSLDNEALDGAAASLALIKPLCGAPIEIAYHELLVEIVENAYTSPRKAYRTFVRLYNIVGRISHSDFKNLINHRNGVAQLLLSHFFAFHLLLRRVTEVESFHRNMLPINRVIDSWVKIIDIRLKTNLKKYHEWPMLYISSCTPSIEI